MLPVPRELCDNQMTFTEFALFPSPLLRWQQLTSLSWNNGVYTILHFATAILCPFFVPECPQGNTKRSYGVGQAPAPVRGDTKSEGKKGCSQSCT